MGGMLELITVMSLMIAQVCHLVYGMMLIPIYLTVHIGSLLMNSYAI